MLKILSGGRLSTGNTLFINSPFLSKKRHVVFLSYDVRVEMMERNKRWLALAKLSIVSIATRTFFIDLH